MNTQLQRIRKELAKVQIGLIEIREWIHQTDPTHTLEWDIPFMKDCFERFLNFAEKVKYSGKEYVFAEKIIEEGLQITELMVQFRIQGSRRQKFSEDHKAFLFFGDFLMITEYCSWFQLQKEEIQRAINKLTEMIINGDVVPPSWDQKIFLKEVISSSDALVSIIKRTLEKSGLFTVHTTVSWNVTQASIPPTN